MNKSKAEDEFKKHGFLSEQLDEWRTYFRASYAPWLEFYRDLNAVAQSAFGKAVVHDDNNQEMLAGMLMVRALSNYQAVLLLVEQGLAAEPKAVLRSMIETTFVFVAACKDASFVEHFVNHCSVKDFNYVRDLSKTDGGKSDPEIAKSLEALQKRKKNAKSLTVKEIAEAAGMSAIYQSEYSLLCLYGHPTLQPLLESIRRNEKGRPSHCVLSRTDSDSIDTLHTAIVMMSFVFIEFVELFNLALGEDRQRIGRKMLAANKAYQHILDGKPSHPTSGQKKSF
jgi:hypothetical protein